MRQMIKKAAVVLSVVMVCAPLSVMAANKLIVKGTDGMTDKMVVTDTGNIGIGNSNPNMAITISKPGTTGETSMMFHNLGGLPYGQYNSGAFFFMRNNDISVNGGLPQSGDRLGSISFGSNTAAGLKYGANISSLTSAAWSTTSFPAFLSFQTTGAAGTAPSERMRINSEGNIGVGTAAPSQKIEVNGGIRLNVTSTKPTCLSTVRGTVWFTQGAAGVADTFEVCAKDAADAYSWKALF